MRRWPHASCAPPPSLRAAQPGRLAGLEARLGRAAGVALEARQARLNALGERLESLDPKRVLARGYAWLEDEAGQAVTSADGLAVGQSVRAVLADGEVSADITSVVVRG